MFCDNAEEVWFQIFEILDRIIRGDQEHCMLLSYLPYFRTWLTTVSLGTMNRLSDYFKKNLHLYLRDKVSVENIYTEVNFIPNLFEIFAL